MGEEIEKSDMSNTLFPEISPSIKKEYQDNDTRENEVFVCETVTNRKENTFVIKEEIENNEYLENKLFVCETTISTMDNIKREILSSEVDNNMINDNIQVINESSTTDIKIESSNAELFCDNCHEVYQDYCTKCGMLAHILNSNSVSSTNDRNGEELPRNILEIRETFGQKGIFTLKVIPDGVRFGPFAGLVTSGCTWKLKGGKLTVSEDKSKYLNWMQYVNPAGNVSERNLLPFRYGAYLYYRSTREIQEGEELLVYFGEEYADNLHKNVTMDFVPAEACKITDTFACTYCCFGFSSIEYLKRHQTVCPNRTIGIVKIEESAQSPFCKVYLKEKTYSENHNMTYCCDDNAGEGILPTPADQMVETNGCKTIGRQIHKCTQCEYRTIHKSDFASHEREHCEGKIYNCAVCRKKFAKEEFLELHMESAHTDVEGDSPKARGKFKCTHCDFQTKNRYYLTMHVKVKHLKAVNYKCSVCGYDTNYKPHYTAHVQRKHLKEIKYRCAQCDFVSNYKSCLKEHVNGKHLKVTQYKCDDCDFETSYKSSLREHANAKHLREPDYKCKECDYTTSYRSNLETHVNGKHLKKFNFKCAECGYESSYKSNLEAHINNKHLKKINYKCGQCEYETSYKTCLDKHIKRRHLKEVSYKCDECDFVTTYKATLKVHVNGEHLEKPNHECAHCGYKTIYKSSFKRHMNLKHIGEVN